MHPVRFTSIAPLNSNTRHLVHQPERPILMNIDKKIVDDLVANDVSFVTTVNAGLKLRQSPEQ